MKIWAVSLSTTELSPRSLTAFVYHCSAVERWFIRIKQIYTDILPKLLQFAGKLIWVYIHQLSFAVANSSMLIINYPHNPRGTEVPYPH